MAVYLLQLLDVEYPKSFAVYYPNDTLKWGKSVERLRKQVSLSDTTLATNEKYIGYLSDYWRLKTANASNRDSAFFAAAQSIPTPALRNAVLYKELESRIASTNDSVRRNGWLQQWLPAVSNVVFQQQLQEQAARMNSLQKGRPAPAFAALGMNDKDFNLSLLSRRYIVIDVWATWCGPCKREKPHFEELAERYTSENVAFVSLSIDEDKDAWRRGLSDASKRVLQLWAKNAAEDFGKSYAVASIPRFILIDPKGRIVNAQMPPPSDPEFEATLKREIPYLDRY
ncbi:MAG: hypothetical protein JWP69_1203 [Flaviaesturariibacter sp.]|nr:hypothetical protein [Flaviaesturariibacter sp.]